MNKRLSSFLLLATFSYALIFVFAVIPVGAQSDVIIDQESYIYSGTLTFVNHADFYSQTARIYTGTTNYYAYYDITGVAASDYDLYAWIRQDAGYGAMRYTVAELYLDTLDFSSLTDGWNLVGSITVSEPDTDPPRLVIDRADTGSGILVIDAVKLVATTSATTATTTTDTTSIYFDLPSTDDTVLYQRELTAGDVIGAAGIWALLILAVSVQIWRVARGEN